MHVGGVADAGIIGLTCAMSGQAKNSSRCLAVELMRLTWLILHREQRHRCAPDAECPYLVITRPHAGHLGVFIPLR